MEVLEERRADGVDGNEKVSNAFAGKDTKGRTDRAYWVIRCRSSKVTAFLISIVAMQIVSMVAKGSVIF
ncbi:unnamed protein product [Gongylonema pulchrum]|uniref:Uncharacterized protein n=1 Tax=Gongylonema pulchrum TaxID=637853 RepID=A0A183EXK0_9BILA|nr:unnamed protein product [Gongylonema pulchrum]